MSTLVSKYYPFYPAQPGLNALFADVDRAILPLRSMMSELLQCVHFVDISTHKQPRITQLFNKIQYRRGEMTVDEFCEIFASFGIDITTSTGVPCPIEWTNFINACRHAYGYWVVYGNDTLI